MSPTAPGRRPQPHRVTLAEVAARAHVDPSVVSKVVNEDPALSIRPETRRRVLTAIRETGYRPNVLARSLRAARTGMLGLFVADFADPETARIAAGVEAASTALGMLLVAGSSAGPGLRRYVDLLGGGRVDGLLIAGTGANAGVVGQLSRLGVPWLVLGRDAGTVRRYVTLDESRAAALAAGHAASLGHRRIAHLTARRTHGTRIGGAAAMRALLRRAVPPTAVIAADLASATGALDVLREARVSVPDDVSLVVCHDVPAAAYTTPPLTGVRMPFEQLGRRGVEVIAGTDPDVPVAEVIRSGFELVDRGSTAPPR